MYHIGHAIAQPTTQLPELTMEPVFQSIVHAEAPAYLDAEMCALTADVQWTENVQICPVASAIGMGRGRAAWGRGRG